jgi:polysaccharide export outer membrane protein
MKKSKLILFVALAAFAMFSSSCATSKKVSYLQDMPKEGVPLNDNLEATICPYDELRIQVYSNGDDNELVRPFNITGGIGQGGYGNGYGYGYGGYIVDIHGNIQFPILGDIHVEGLTRLQLQDTIRTKLETNGYINNPLVLARFMNFRVFFLSPTGGQVINVANERCTFLEALAMAGGGVMDLYTRRDRIGVMRDVNGKRVIHYLDPRSVSVFEDEFFLLQQNDIIFTEVSTRRFLQEGFSNWTFALSAVSSILSVLGLWATISNFVKKP